MLDLWPKRSRRGSGRTERLKVVLHVGPHKTGTTSLQGALLRQYGSKKPRAIWYPVPPSGPGHAFVARKTLQPARCADEPYPDVRAIVEAADGARCGTLILSSESFAYAYPARLELLASQMADVDLQVVITLSSIGQRAVSIWQELIKHKHVQSLGGEDSLALHHPGLEPDFTRSFGTHFPAAKISVVIASRADPRRLFHLFSEATGIELVAPPGAASSANPSLGQVEAEILRTFNISAAELVLPDDNYQRVRSMLRSLFRSEKWRAAVPFVQLRPPQAWTTRLQMQCRETIRDLKALAAGGRIGVFGDLGELDDLSASKQFLSKVEAASTEEDDKIASGMSTAAGVRLPVTRQA